MADSTAAKQMIVNPIKAKQRQADIKKMVAAADSERFDDDESEGSDEDSDGDSEKSEDDGSDEDVGARRKKVSVM